MAGLASRSAERRIDSAALRYDAGLQGADELELGRVHKKQMFERTEEQDGLLQVDVRIDDYSVAGEVLTLDGLSNSAGYTLDKRE